MSKAGKVFAVAVLAALAWAVAGAQPPIRIGATLSQTGVYGALGPNQLREVRAANPDVLGGATRFEDSVAITRQLKASAAS